MESMLASYSGFHHVMIPEAVSYELRHGGSHDYRLPDGFWHRFDNSLAVSKLHVEGNQHNAAQLRAAELPYLIMYRDLRDVAVSHYFYVRRTPWHPEYEDYASLSVKEGLLHFARTLLPEFAQWIRSWRSRKDDELALELRYEDLLENTETKFRQVASHFGLESGTRNTSSKRIKEIVDAHQFENMSGGRKRGNQDESSFVRKGVAGDWRNYFSKKIEKEYDKKVSKLLREMGYK
jgi:hypothetical protein